MHYITNIEIIKGREWVKRAMRSTQGKFGSTTPLTDKTFLRLLIARHSVIEEFEIWIDAEVPERVHTHIVRHKEIGKYIATSRPDIANNTSIQNGIRKLSLRINAKRLLEIMDQRLCEKAWKQTKDFFEEISCKLRTIDPVLSSVLVSPCIRLGFCPETSRTCGWTKTEIFEYQRTHWLEMISKISE